MSQEPAAETRAHGSAAADVYRARPVRGLIDNWAFEPQRPALWTSVRRAYVRATKSRRPPAHQCLKPLTSRHRWFVFFAFTPQGQLSPAQHFALSRLRDMGEAVFVVCGAPGVQQVPQELHGYADALYWKALSGYDFSAYSLALWEVARHSPHADVCVLNDSVFGPFFDLRPFFAGAPWAFTGFTALDSTENHIQSYAFMVRDVAPERMQQLRSIFDPDRALDLAVDVILCQETRMGRVASQAMSAGAYWYAQEATCLDATLAKPFDLIDVGFPFMKKSLLGRMAVFQPRDAVLATLERVGHPRIE